MSTQLETLRRVLGPSAFERRAEHVARLERLLEELAMVQGPQETDGRPREAVAIWLYDPLQLAQAARWLFDHGARVEDD